MRFEHDEVRKAYWKGVAVGLVVMNLIWVGVLTLIWRAAS